MDSKHRPGVVPVFIGCDDRVVLDKIVAKIASDTGYRPTLRAVTAKAIAEYAKQVRAK